MQEYFSNKLLSFAGVFLCILASLFFFGYTTEQWQVILLSIIIFGYGHFLIGFYYQLRSFTRCSHPWQQYLTFSFLVVFSVIFAHILFEYLGFVAALFLGFLYFLFHGLLNEQTLIKRQTGVLVPLVPLTALAIFIISLLTFSIPDETFFFDQRLQFMDIDEFWVGYVFEKYYMSLASFTQVFWIGTIASLAVLALAWIWKGWGKLVLAFAVAIMGITGLVYVFGPPAYIYMYLFVVGYHFMTWFLFYVIEMHRRGKKQFRTFLIQHTLVLGPLVYCAYLFMQPITPEFVYYVFDYKLFVVMTYIHISTSFMNDEWLQNVQKRIFRQG